MNVSFDNGVSHYDAMRDAANLAVATLLSQSIECGGPRPHSDIIREVRALRAEVAAIAPGNSQSVREATLRFAAIGATRPVAGD